MPPQGALTFLVILPESECSIAGKTVSPMCCSGIQANATEQIDFRFTTKWAVEGFPVITEGTRIQSKMWVVVRELEFAEVER